MTKRTRLISDLSRRRKRSKRSWRDFFSLERTSTVEESIEEKGKRPLSTKWVMREPTPKKPKWKARLVVRGFEEPKRSSEMNFAGTTET